MRQNPKTQFILFIKSHPKKLLILSVLSIAYYFCLPKQIFNTPTATVIESKSGSLLGAKIADDGQWRFPPLDSLPHKFKVCILQFEDAYFYQHLGFNPVSMSKALMSNLSKGKILRGGSTITQQVIRLSRNGKRRSYWEKIIELILATRLELRESKENILKHYASHAPYGGNVVGLDVAAWRYFGLRPHQLSWAETATLAVLPNAPSLIYPGKNQHKLITKRNRLLKKIFHQNLIDTTTYRLALLEKLPQKPYPLPKIAPHLIQYISKKNKGKRIRTTIDENLQRNINTIVQKHHENLKQNQVHNAAVLVMDVNTRQVLSYVGNTQTTKEHQKDVDMIRANRSTGSVLKPLLYAAMLDAGELLPDMLIADIPTQIAGYTPQNYNDNYSGAIRAKSALARSLNIPAVRLLQQYGLAKFRHQLNFFKLKGINKSSNHYGLTLILGGAESNLWDLCKTYANMGSTINHYQSSFGKYFSNEFVSPILKMNQKVNFGTENNQKNIFDAASIYLTFEAMKEVNRPEESESWEFYDSSKEIAWKTGTSFGNKDAWAIGITKNHVVGVWIGNADGEGRPNVTGVSSAAPILFDVFDLLPRSDWFSKPLDEFVPIKICKQSGYLATDICPSEVVDIPNKANYIAPCHYHHMIHLVRQQHFRVNSSCADLSKTNTVSWFTLPPLMEFYYKKSHPTYQSLPPFGKDCKRTNQSLMGFIYPKNGSRITLPKNFKGNINELILKLTHTNADATVFWYLDETYITQTTTIHEVGIIPKIGKHKITVVDTLGNKLSIKITIE